eukprot:gene3621-3884_t
MVTLENMQHHLRTAQEWLMKDVRVDVLSTFDARHMNPKETTALILITAMAWLLLEVVLQIVARPFLYSYFYPNGAPLHKKGQREAAATVTGGVERLVGTVFNFLQISLGIMVLLQPEVNRNTIYGHTQLSTLMCLIASGYFLYDLIAVLLRMEGFAFLIHACCCLFVYTYAVYSFNLHFFGAGFLLWELSTPFVHYRWFLLKSNQTKTRTYIVNGIIMAVVFLACRPVWGTYLSYRFFVDTEEELRHPVGNFSPSGIWGYRIANVALNLLNYFWFLKIATKLVETLAPKSRKACAGKIC